MSAGIYLFVRNPSSFGWPRAFVVNEWAPDRTRFWAVEFFDETASANDVPLMKAMLRSPDARIRLRGIEIIDRFLSMDEFHELARLTQDADPKVRASAQTHLPFWKDRSLAIAVERAGLRDDSEEVVAASLEKIRLLRAKEALPDLIAFLRRKKKSDSFTELEVAAGNADHAEITLGFLGKFFREITSWHCGTPEAAEQMERLMREDRPIPRLKRAVQSFGLSLLGLYADGPLKDDVPKWSHDEPWSISGDVIADDIVQRDKLLRWWEKRGVLRNSSSSE